MAVVASQDKPNWPHRVPSKQWNVIDEMAMKMSPWKRVALLKQLVSTYPAGSIVDAKDKTMSVFNPFTDDRIQLTKMMINDPMEEKSDESKRWLCYGYSEKLKRSVIVKWENGLHANPKLLTTIQLLQKHHVPTYEMYTNYFFWGEPVLVMEVITTLDNIPRKMKHGMALNVLKQISRQFAVMHRDAHIFHQDIKPENIGFRINTKLESFLIDWDEACIGKCFDDNARSILTPLYHVNDEISAKLVGTWRQELLEFLIVVAALEYGAGRNRVEMQQKMVNIFSAEVRTLSSLDRRLFHAQRFLFSYPASGTPPSRQWYTAFAEVCRGKMSSIPQPRQKDSKPYVRLRHVLPPRRATRKHVDLISERIDTRLLFKDLIENLLSIHRSGYLLATLKLNYICFIPSEKRFAFANATPLIKNKSFGNFGALRSHAIESKLGDESYFLSIHPGMVYSLTLPHILPRTWKHDVIDLCALMGHIFVQQMVHQKRATPLFLEKMSKKMSLEERRNDLLNFVHNINDLKQTETDEKMLESMLARIKKNQGFLQPTIFGKCIRMVNASTSSPVMNANEKKQIFAFVKSKVLQ